MNEELQLKREQLSAMLQNSLDAGRKGNYDSCRYWLDGADVLLRSIERDLLVAEQS